MRKKIYAFCLVGLLGIGMLLQSISIDAATQWNYGNVNTSAGKFAGSYSNYYDSLKVHYTGITVGNTFYRTSNISKANWAKIIVNHSAAYKRSFTKYSYAW